VKSSTETSAGWACWRDRTIRSGLARPEADHVPGGHIVGIEQGLVFGPAAEERVAGVARVLQDRSHRAALPAIGQPMAVLIGSARGRARDDVAVETVGDRPVAVAVEVFGEDPPHDVRRSSVNREHP
jgi:hypothetical protein